MRAEHKVCISVPQHLAKWLMYLESEGIETSALIRELLQRLYDVWVLGAREGEQAIETVSTMEPCETLEIKPSEKILEIIRKCEEAKVCDKERNIYKKFAMWLQSHGINICSATDDHVKSFVSTYATLRKVKSNTANYMTWHLRRFLRFAHETICIGGNK